ncbi:hypothetical protein SAMN04487911_14027 [Arenibacter nanhaiticus]|uniref:Oxidoreductase NAD-binding domain-containing protein n=2 Tax=Arenibacter nanhaiticus TaxID=558155 RepID=A0A1M6ME49_9FLAO|nr:hypothetical protein SAMN04487911_14027 [Arenibacter nanhaiticus]
MNILSEEASDKFAHGYIMGNLIKKNTDLKGYFYVCGALKMMEAVEKVLSDLQVQENHSITEKF